MFAFEAFKAIVFDFELRNYFWMLLGYTVVFCLVGIVCLYFFCNLSFKSEVYVFKILKACQNEHASFFINLTT